MIVEVFEGGIYVIGSDVIWGYNDIFIFLIL